LPVPGGEDDVVLGVYEGERHQVGR
jgi:hypothetical protein